MTITWYIEYICFEAYSRILQFSCGERIIFFSAWNFMCGIVGCLRPYDDPTH